MALTMGTIKLVKLSFLVVFLFLEFMRCRDYHRETTGSARTRVLRELSVINRVFCFDILLQLVTSLIVGTGVEVRSFLPS